jgi:ATP-dependent Clp protease ATP-binding subunit ClpC
VFERFTERGRQSVVLAQDEARALKHNYIGTEHLLLGLLRERDGIPVRVLDAFGITVEEVRMQVARLVGQGDEVTTGQIPFTPRAKKVLELSLREALRLGHREIGTEHVLLGLLREGDGVAVRILAGFTDPERIRQELLSVLTGESGSSVIEMPYEGGSTWPRMPVRPSRLSGGSGITAAAILLGWLLFALALGIGILIGWLIWG